ncbi:phosphonate C-P lyase system protein PhnG [Mycolicibacterium goodii]|uniref:Phosphonate metabolism PhnG family protein n=1 Tax=Mycolicibacterium goodii TaxID=134601 RepID=A0A0K0XB00_MYCGD|nr:phosphonate metabolism PhnG family protein [Mycolicibacterium goodii]
MTPEARMEALASACGDTLEQLADQILACAGVAVAVIAGPESVSAPVRVPVPGPGDTTVVLGHVALTRCTVELGGVRGDGVRAGYDPTGAVAAAICDAEAARQGSLAGRVDELYRKSRQDKAARDRERANTVAMTRMEQP